MQRLPICNRRDAATLGMMEALQRRIEAGP
jgi:hypothetical protein